MTPKQETSKINYYTKFYKSARHLFLARKEALNETQMLWLNKGLAVNEYDGLVEVKSAVLIYLN